MRKYLLILSLLLVVLFTNATDRVRIYGYILTEDNIGIEAANAAIEGTTFGTISNRQGYYDFTITNSPDTLTISYSMLGYETIKQTLIVRRNVYQINVVLPQKTELLDEVEVRAIARQTDMMEQGDIKALDIVPNSQGSIESILVTFSGVRQSNELSSGYNVRGGNYDENSVYVNGIEVYRPLLVRQSQQEGLSFANPDLTESLTFSAGGFSAKYGDKMASVLDITYRKPQALESKIQLSLLGASASVGMGDSTFTMLHGIRYKTNRYMLGALPTKGNYQPNFVDYQTYMTWKMPRWGKRPACQTASPSRCEMSFLGNVSLNDYQFHPSNASIPFGTQANPLQLKQEFIGQEKDRFLTAFAALGVDYQPLRTISLKFMASGYYTNERETYDITTDYVLVSGDKRNPNSVNQELDTTSQANVLGRGTFHQHARNRLSASIITLSHSGSWAAENNRLEWGASVQGEFINDHIQEWEWRDTAGYSIPTQAQEMELYYAMRGESQMKSLRVQGYVEDTYKWYTDNGNVTLNVGLRGQWWSFNNEPLFSPRASVSWRPALKSDLTLRFATGLYYQAPFYKELRDTLTDAAGITRIHLNDKLRAQRSVHCIAGLDYYFRAWGRPFKFSAEAYYKYIDRVVSYTVDNVSIRYSGENDAVAYTTGLDLKLYGQLVPGVDSWLTLSYMRAREDLLYDERGWMNAPQNQTFGASLLFQDYIPQFPQYRFYLKGVYSTGIPYGPPRVLASRALGTMDSYKRIDIGATRQFSAKTDKFMRKSKHIRSWFVAFEVLNLIDWNNTNSYFWVITYDNQQYASPEHLTGRQYNFKMGIEFK